MSSLYRKRFLLTLLLGLLVGGCGTTPPAGETEALAPEVVLPEAAITADGVLVPFASVRLAFPAGGVIEEILVSPGDTVDVGDHLIHLGGNAQVEAAVAAADLELLSARQARQALDDQVDAERARAQQALVAARRALNDAERQLAYAESGSPEAEASRAEAQLIQAESALEDAREAFDDVADRSETDLTRARRQIALADAQLAYDEAARAVDALSEAERAVQIDLAEAAVAAAQAQLRTAEAAYAAVEEGPDADVVAIADARVEAAEAQVSGAQASLEALTLTAPMAGTVVEVAAKAGELAAPAVPLIVLADLSEWWIETDTLTQVDVVGIQVGDTAAVVIDALPEVSYAAEVISIDNLYVEKRGDVTYTARLRLVGTDPEMRWGMTCAVTFPSP